MICTRGVASEEGSEPPLGISRIFKKIITYTPFPQHHALTKSGYATDLHDWLVSPFSNFDDVEK